jgi:hypothetical protein
MPDKGSCPRRKISRDKKIITKKLFAGIAKKRIRGAGFFTTVNK